MSNVFRPYGRDRFDLNLDPNDIFGPRSPLGQPPAVGSAAASPDVFGPAPAIVNQGQGPGLFTPPPTGPMDRPITGIPASPPPQDALAAANAILEPGSGTGDVFGPSSSVRRGSDAMEMPQPPVHLH